MKMSLFFMVFLAWGLTAQNLNFGKWNKFIKNSVSEKKQGIEYNEFFLASTQKLFFKSNSLQKGDSIYRVLDASHYILKSTQKRMDLYSQIEYRQANNLWKLVSVNSKEENVSQLFSVKTKNPSLLIESLKLENIKVVTQNEKIITIETTFNKIVEVLLPLDQVTCVSNESLLPVHESIIKDLDLSINGIFKTLELYPELSGNGENIGVKDNLPDRNDIDLLNKIEVSEIESNEIDTHATDMATIISGTGNSGVKGLGVLPQAVIFPIDFNNLFPDNVSMLDEAGVTLVNNSYGTTIENYYGLLAEAYDEFMYDNPTKLHVFSSGNSGSSSSDNNNYEGITGYANLTGNFKMAKNIITVGALDLNNEILPFSSKGPAYDGRVKPEIVAYSIIGTSNSAALVTGASSILQQAYFNTNSELPPASLIKAALLNGADDIGRPGIDFETGYGSLNAFESLRIINSQNYIIDSIEENQIETFNITLPLDAIDLKVMLVWTDIAAQPNDNVALKNNLDISITNDERTFLPEVLNTEPTLENLQELSMEGVDNLNPVEQVVIKEAKAGNYTINVQSINLETSNQEFSLVYTWKNKDELEWIYPIGDSKLPYNGGNISYLRWKSSFEENKLGNLEVNYDGTDEWELIAESVLLNAGFYNWEFPQSMHTKAQLRFVIDSDNKVSENFVISSGISVSTSLNCEDVTEITWGSKENIIQYQIYNLHADEMQLIDVTTDTTYVFLKDDYPNPYFSIRPVLPDGTESLASETLNTTAFPESCYFNFVFAALEDQKITIDVSLLSIYDIKSIEGFRLNEDNTKTQISFVDTLESFDFKVQDENPTDGENTYQFKVITNNEKEYLSEEFTVRYFSEKNPFLVFPNPTTQEEGIVVFSGLSQNEIAFLELYDLNGRLILSETLTSDVAFVSLDKNSFSKGLYVYRITGDTVETKFVQKIIIQ